MPTISTGSFSGRALGAALLAGLMPLTCVSSLAWSQAATRDGIARLLAQTESKDQSCDSIQSRGAGRGSRRPQPIRVKAIPPTSRHGA